MCKEEPINSNEHVARNWTDADMGVGARATYTCKGNAFVLAKIRRDFFTEIKVCLV